MASNSNGKAENAGGCFDRRAELIAVLRQGPAKASAAPAAAGCALAPSPEPEAAVGSDRISTDVAVSEAVPSAAATPPAAGTKSEPVVRPSRWQLTTIQAAVPWLQPYSLSGVWHILRRYGLKLRTASVQQYSPDPDYTSKFEHLLACLRQSAQAPTTNVFLFMDQMGYYRWPEPTHLWWPGPPAPPPQTERQHSKQEQWRIIGVLNALTGQVNYLDGYIVGRSKVIAMYQQIATTYAKADHIFVAQDNWSIHKHDDVAAVLTTLPKIEPVWLPTYSPWLNPIEKLWRWLRHDILNAHRLAADWPLLRQQVNGFLKQFANGSQALLRYVGLLGDGKLAHALRYP